MKTVCVIGGGIAGLSTAVFLASRLEDRVSITLFEASPKLGGRAYSFFDKDTGSYIDNGQHILASWYENTIGFLEIIGTASKLKFQNQLEVHFADLNGRRFTLRCPRLTPPLHLIAGIMGFGAVGLNDRLGILRIVRAIKRNKFTAGYLSRLNTDELFRRTRQTTRLINNFWRPFIAAVFNAEPEETSALLFVNMIRKGFLSKGNSNLVLPVSNLNSLYVDASIEYLKQRNVTITCSARVKEFSMNDSFVNFAVNEQNEKTVFDYYVSAVPFFDFGRLTGYKLHDDLHPSPIVNVHHAIDRDIDDIMKEQFIGILNGTIQWVFKTGERQICIVISSAKDLVNLDKDELTRKSIDELQKAIPEFKRVNYIHSKVVKEKRATFIPDNASLSLRPECETKYKNLFIAGDWTNTGYPATLESAVTSAKKCAELIEKQINHLQT